MATVSPDRLRSRLRCLAVALFLVAALCLGFAIGGFTDDDIITSRQQAIARFQCQIDLLLLPVEPENRLEVLGGDPDVNAVCEAAQEIVRPGDPPPEIGP